MRRQKLVGGSASANNAQENFYFRSRFQAICSFFIIFKYNIIPSMNLIQIISGLIAAALGALAVIYTEWIVQNLGYNEWAEAKMSMWGGSRMLYKIIGVLVVLGGLLYAFDLLDKFIFGLGKVFFGMQ